MVRRGKRYVDAAKQIDRAASYAPAEAIRLAKESAKAKFNETMELHIRTSADPRQADQLVRGVVVLPHGLGKPVKILVFATGEGARAAREAGADYVGDEDLAKQIEGGWLDFDVAVATPDMMNKIGRLGRILGRRGLMPNPRAGTVVQPQDLPRVIREAKLGRVEYRMDRTAIMHMPIGKAGFSQDQLLENFSLLVDTIARERPSGIKGQFIRSMYLTSTMGPSVKVNVEEALSKKVE
ncbi:MAG: 50S ribosomal protein L1 [Chloroflexi bacterium]|nr:50S ribosomal protein L1 [Chloroflexota bacterium]